MSSPAAEAIAGFVGAESSQLDEIQNAGSRNSRCEIQNSLARLEVCRD